MNHKGRRCRLFSFAVLMSIAQIVAAQEARGRITGRVLDPSKSAVPAASVKVTDVARGTTVSLTTNDQGLFQANYLLIGTYQVVVEIAGFKKHVTSEVVIGLNETRDLTIELEVGGVEETINVTSESLTNTSDANMGLSVDTRRLAELPLIHGDPYKITGLAPGLAHSGAQRLDRPYEPTHIIGYAMAGARSNRNDLLIDGISSTSTANANEIIASYVPISDLVQEFKVQTATFDAQFGNTEGGVTSIGIKTGTNKLHGSAYYWTQPTGWGANDAFGKARGQERVEFSSERPGFTLTGPVVKDKTFFTIGWERIDDKRPRFDATTAWVPTEALRNGDFSAFSDKITIYDPLTRRETEPGSGQYTSDPFPGNVIPADRINPVAKGILSYIALPKSSGLVGNVYDSTLKEQALYNNATFRIDQHFSARNRMFVRGSHYKRDSTYNDYYGNDVTTSNFQFISYQAVIDDVHMISPTTVLNVRYGYNRFERNNGQMPDYGSDFDLTSLGFPAEYHNIVPPADRRFPRLDMPGTMVDIAFGADFRPTTTHTFAAVLNKSLARHAVKAGVEMRIYREDSRPTGNATSGFYTFNNTYTRQRSSGSTDEDYEGLQGYASFLLGLPATSRIDRLVDYSEFSKTWGFFIHDDWRVNNKLTLNLGLRYEVETPLTERQNKSVSGFDYEYVQPIQAAAQAKYATLNDPSLKAAVPQLNVKGGLMYAGVDTGKTLYNAPKDSILPRFGFAYQVDRKTIIRGGVGLFAGFLGQRRGDVITTGYSQTTNAGTTTNANGAPIAEDIRTALLNTTILEPKGNSNGRQSNLGQTISFFNQDPQVSKNLRFQISIQRELANGLLVEAAYVGNRGYDIEITRNINALPIQYLNTDNSRTDAMNANNTWLTATVTNPLAGLLPGSTYNNATIARDRLLRPYPAYGNINTTNNDGKSWYDSAQLSVRKRFSKGNTVGIAYTYSKFEEATIYLNDADPDPCRQPSDLDVTHRVAVSAIVELPFGKGRKILSNASGIANAIVGGWQVQGVYTYQTGFPVRFANDAFWDGSSIAIDDPTPAKWFNTDAFTSRLNDTTTNATPVNHRRTLPYYFDDVRADNIDNLDLSLIKDVQLSGDIKLQLRAEFINALNEPYLATGNGQIVVNPTASNFGQISASNQQNYARRAQIGVKLLF
ncbi:MAG: TonB-dependent receptor [Vicinamibacteria bacterium]|nr:TonB-dependent receptor [Vicinamibacteria bacterium]